MLNRNEGWERQTMRPVIRGRQAAVSSMKAEATESARRILEAGGNAFDAAVAGQAALAVTDFPMNGVGGANTELCGKFSYPKIDVSGNNVSALRKRNKPLASRRATRFVEDFRNANRRNDQV